MLLEKERRLIDCPCLGGNILGHHSQSTDLYRARESTRIESASQKYTARYTHI